MSTNKPKRAELEQALTFRFMQQLSASTLIFHQALAEQLGLNPTDVRCLDIVSSESDVTAGRLAEITGLTTPAVTNVIDRLEWAGFVKREKDEADRRRVIIRPLRAREAKVGRRFESLERVLGQLYAHYTTPELALINDFAAGIDQIMRTEAMNLRNRDAGVKPEKS